MKDLKVKEDTIKNIGSIGNEYGGLSVAETECGRCAWAIENYDIYRWELISESLYFELLCHDDEK